MAQGEPVLATLRVERSVAVQRSRSMSSLNRATTQPLILQKALAWRCLYNLEGKNLCFKESIFLKVWLLSATCVAISAKYRSGPTPACCVHIKRDACNARSPALSESTVRNSNQKNDPHTAVVFHFLWREV